MTNLTSKEIQDAREFITEDEYECGDSYYDQPISEILKEHFAPIKQALDMAEKQAWRTDTPPYQEMVLFIFRYSLNGQDYYDFRNGMVSDDGSDDIHNELGDPLDGYNLQDIVWWTPLPAPPSIETRPADVETLPIDAFDFSPEEGAIILETSIAGSTLSDVAKKAGKSASDKVKLSKRV